MAIDREGRAGWHQATLRTSKRIRETTSLAAHIKAAVAGPSTWGLLPLAVTVWLIVQGGPDDA